MPGYRILARWRDDNRGNVMAVSAMVMLVMMGLSALGIDVAKYYVDRRKAQATVDLAALAAASNLQNAPALANATVAQNNITLASPLSLQYGTYSSNGATTPGARFLPSAASSATAVRIGLQTQTPTFFGRLVSGQANYPITTAATATTTAFASFAIGDRLATVDNGLMNQLLGAMLGTNLSLSVLDYQSLMSANLDAFGFLNAAAVRANVSGQTYSSLLTTKIKVGALANAMIDAAGAGSQAATALNKLVAALQGSTATLPLGSLINVGPYAQLSTGQAPAGGGTLTPFDILTSVARLASGQQPIAVGLSLQVPGITSATMSIAVNAPAVGSGWFAIGAVGASVHTAQTRVLLQLQVQGLAPLASLNVPIYIEIAPGTATLNALFCGYPDISTSSVTLGVQPGIADAWIGNVSTSDFANFTWPVNPGVASLAQVTGLSVTGQAHVTMSNSSATPVTFSYADMAVPTKKTVSTTNYTSSLFEALIGNLTVNVSFGGLGLGLPGPITQAVSGSLNAIAAPLDVKLASITAALGVGLGQADTWVSAIRCDGAVLVN